MFQRNWISEEQFFDEKDLPGEVWVELAEYRGQRIKKYQISNKGRIKSSNGNIIHGSITFDGYHEVNLIKDDEFHSCLTARAHAIILTAFQGGPPSNMVNPTVQHLNHNKLDNRIENLCWMSSFENNQEGHGCKAKIVDAEGEHIFPSQKMASRYIGRHDDYISEGISRGYKLKDADGNPIEVFTEHDGEWVKYTVPDQRNRQKCRLVLDGQEHDFETLFACDDFLGKDHGYTTNMMQYSWPIVPDSDHQFYKYDFDICEYKLYIPTKKRVKRYSNQCQITYPSGESFTYPSMTKAAIAIGRDPEYLRIAIRDNKVIKDKDGITVTAIRFD